MSVVDVRVNLADVERGIRALKENGRDLQRVFRAVGPEAREDQAKHARSAMGPDGPWPQRAASTTERLLARPRGRTAKGRKRARRRPGLLLGRLPKAIQLRATRSDLTISSTVEWADVHHSGGTAGRGSRIPQREFLWWSQPFVERVVDLIERFVIEPWERGR